MLLRLYGGCRCPGDQSLCDLWKKFKYGGWEYPSQARKYSQAKQIDINSHLLQTTFLGTQLNNYFHWWWFLVYLAQAIGATNSNLY